MSTHHKPKRTYLRIIFATLITAALVYLIIVIRSFVLDAELALGGMTPVDATSLRTMVLNQSTYDVPEDSLLTQRQIMVFTDVITAVDSLDGTKGELPARDRRIIRRRMADILNANAMSLSEYRYIRQLVLTALDANDARFDEKSMWLVSLRTIVRDHAARIRNHRSVMDRRTDSEALK
jgi:hypothetical protein